MIKEIKITSPDKIIYPKQKIKKIDVINYYSQVSELMLPFIKERLLSVIRCHEGIHGETFFKKHAANDKEVEVFDFEGKDLFYVKNVKQLIYQAQMGTIEFHTWASRIKNFNSPDVMTFDLDPDEELVIDELRDAVLKVKSVLDSLGLQSFLKTSGGKGYHIAVPFKKSKNWESFYTFSKSVAQIAEQKWPKTFTTNIRKAERKGKIFIDYLRNNFGSTCVAPYSLRIKDGAPISMPIFWQDLKNITPNYVTINNFAKYLNESWLNFFNVKQQLK